MQELCIHKTLCIHYANITQKMPQIMQTLRSYYADIMYSLRKDYDEIMQWLHITYAALAVTL